MAASPRPVTKTRAAFCLVTSAITRLARQVCADILHIRRAARQPLTPVNITLIRQECMYLFIFSINLTSYSVFLNIAYYSNVAECIYLNIVHSHRVMLFYHFYCVQNYAAAN